MKITKEQLKETLRNIMKEESEYQTFFRKALEKSGKSITDMSDDEKKDFFNKIDAAWNSKGEKNEGNAFGAAVTAAKEKGEDEFEVGGKTYKVESVNEDVALSRLNSIQDAREQMISFISYKMANGENKPDSWYDRTEKSLSKKSYKDLEKLYLKLGGKKIKIESVNEGRKSKDGWGVRLVIAIANNVDAIVELVMDDKRDPKEVMSAFANPLLNSVKGVSKHNYKPNAKPAYTLKRDLQHHGDLTNQQRLDIFKSEIKKFEKIVEALIKKPTKVGVKQLGDAWRTIWNHKYGANIALNGEGPHDNTIIEVASNTNNESINEVNYSDQTGAKNGSLLDSELRALFSPKELKWAKSDSVKLYKGIGMNFFFTDGKVSIGVNMNRPRSVVKKLGKVDNELKKAYLNSTSNESVNEEKYTVIDPRGNQMGAGLKLQAAAMAKKKGGEKAGYFVVPAKNALKARRALEKFKGDFKNPKLKDIMSDLFWESVESITEGRAFINAAKKAKAEGKTEFEFNGKTYPVTIKD